MFESNSSANRSRPRPWLWHKTSKVEALSSSNASAAIGIGVILIVGFSTLPLPKHVGQTRLKIRPLILPLPPHLIHSSVFFIFCFPPSLFTHTWVPCLYLRLIINIDFYKIVKKEGSNHLCFKDYHLKCSIEIWILNLMTSEEEICKSKPFNCFEIALK